MGRARGWCKGREVENEGEVTRTAQTKRPEQVVRVGEVVGGEGRNAYAGAWKGQMRVDGAAWDAELGVSR